MFTRHLPIEYRSREPTLDSWIALGYQRDAASLMLSIMSRAFRISGTDSLRLRPDDEVWALYRYYYPSRAGILRQMDIRPDELEIETLERDLRKVVPLGRRGELHLSVTVGDLVKLLQT